MIVELEKLTIRVLIERSYHLYSSLLSVGYVGDVPITYQQLQAKVQQIATKLHGRNIKKGDKVAILGENSPNWVISYLAITSMGAVAVPILPGFPDTDTRHIIRNSESTAIFVAQKLQSKLEDMENSLLHSVFSLEDFSFTELKKQHTSILEKAARLFKKEDKSSATGENIPEPEADDLAAIIYTSGTTGMSKGVMLTHRNIVSDVVNSIERFPIDSTDRFLSILPLSHTFEATGGMLCPLAVGVTIFYLKGMPTPQKLLSAMEAIHPTGLLTVPLVIDKIFRKRILPQIQSKKMVNKLYHMAFFRKQLHRIAGKKLVRSFGGKLRFLMFGGAALNKDVETFLRDAKINYSTGYGMTETSPILTINPFGMVKMGSCGKPIPGIDIRIHEPDQETGIGEIIIHGSIVMQGYYKNPEATKATFLEDGWLKTGDLGYFDSEGFLFIKGRSKNVIVGPSGENIYPEIIEQQLLHSNYLQEVIVYEDKGRLIAKAYLDFDFLDQEFEINKMSGAEAEKLIQEILEQVRQEANAQLPSFSHISRIMDHPEPFEKTPTNKVKRYLYIPGA
jgi:long-chain acyl-CoA synthetase